MELGSGALGGNGLSAGQTFVVDVPFFFAVRDEAVALVESIGGTFAQGGQANRFSRGVGDGDEVIEEGGTETL